MGGKGIDSSALGNSVTKASQSFQQQPSNDGSLASGLSLFGSNLGSGLAAGKPDKVVDMTPQVNKPSVINPPITSPMLNGPASGPPPTLFNMKPPITSPMYGGPTTGLTLNKPITSPMAGPTGFTMNPPITSPMAPPQFPVAAGKPNPQQPPQVIGSPMANGSRLFD